MRHTTELLSDYAKYHRDPRNISTHLVGVPMIVFGVGVLLARLHMNIFDFDVSAAWVVFAAAASWYLTRGDLVLGAAVSGVVGVLIWLGHLVAYGSVTTWLAWGVGTFVAGWVIQFVGHWYEGKKPAFVDDIVGLLIGPMFVTAEVLFGLGWNKPMLAEIERRAGPTMLRDMARIA